VVQVVIASSLARGLVGGAETLDVEAGDARAMLRALDTRFPGFADYVREHMAVAIDGVIYQGTLDQPIDANSEVVLIPRIAGGQSLIGFD